MVVTTRGKPGPAAGQGADTPAPSTSHAAPPPMAQSQHPPTEAGLPPSLQDIHNNITEDIKNISEEGKTIVSTIIKAFQLFLAQKDTKIEELNSEVTVLKETVSLLENQLDDINQYERRDTLIIGGPALPQEQPQENSAELICRTIKDNLHLNISPSDINIAHRIGTKNTQNSKRPVIVKLHSREKKSEIMQACITVKPNLHINESLTPKRRALFKTIWNIRKKHREQFKQCYTQDGKICIKLTSSQQKHIITTDEALANFLDKHPIFKHSL